MEKTSSRVFERSNANTPDSSQRRDHFSSSPSRTGLAGAPEGRGEEFVMPLDAIRGGSRRPLLYRRLSPLLLRGPADPQPVMIAGSLTPAAPVSTWPASRRRKPVSVSDFTVRSYQRLVARRSTVCCTSAPALTLKVWGVPP